ncbi:hypothetical protein Plhal304r1_c018g0064771 [Plasmopara halstedii]
MAVEVHSKHVCHLHCGELRGHIAIETWLNPSLQFKPYWVVVIRFEKVSSAGCAFGSDQEDGLDQRSNENRPSRSMRSRSVSQTRRA